LYWKAICSFNNENGPSKGMFLKLLFILFFPMYKIVFQILLQFEFQECEETVQEIKRHPVSLFSEPLEPLIIKIVPLK